MPTTYSTLICDTANIESHHSTSFCVHADTSSHTPTHAYKKHLQGSQGCHLTVPSCSALSGTSKNGRRDETRHFSILFSSKPLRYSRTLSSPETLSPNTKGNVGKKDRMVQLRQQNNKKKTTTMCLHYLITPKTTTKCKQIKSPHFYANTGFLDSVRGFWQYTAINCQKSLALLSLIVRKTCQL